MCSPLPLFVDRATKPRCTTLQYGIDLASPQELIAHGKTRQDIAKHINADDVIYQDLDALKAACTEASPDARIIDFEVGVFCGKYKTEVPEGYFEHLNESRGKKRKIAGFTDGPNSTAPGSSGPVNERVPRAAGDELRLGLRSLGAADADRDALANLGPRSPEHREDIRYAYLKIDYCVHEY